MLAGFASDSAGKYIERGVRYLIGLGRVQAWDTHGIHMGYAL